MQQEKNMLLSPMALSSSKPMAKQWFLPPEADTVEIFLEEKGLFCTWENGFRTAPFCKVSQREI